MAVEAALREPRSTESAVAASARRERVDALIEEARKRARRRRLIYGAAAAAIVAVAAIAATASRNDVIPLHRQASALDTAAGASPAGVFEPVRGWIVYSVGHEVKAVDPADPSSVHTLALPDGLVAGLPAGANVVPAGWSADGTRLALSSEYSGDSYVMDASGAIMRARGDGGCCWFVTGPWLSPDGTTVLEIIDGHRLRLRNLEDANASRVIELAPPLGDLRTGGVSVTAWSPDSTQIAYTVLRNVATDLLPSVYVVDLKTGTTRQLVLPGFGHIRQMTWSPDGSQLLVIAGPWRQSTIKEMLNPLLSPKQTGLYLVDTYGSSPARPPLSLREIASGHYVAATWSPDGSRIAAIDFGPVGRRLVSMKADGSASRVLVDLPSYELFTGLAWHPKPDR